MKQFHINLSIDLSIAAVSKEWCSAAEYCSLYVILAGSASIQIWQSKLLSIHCVLYALKALKAYNATSKITGNILCSLCITCSERVCNERKILMPFCHYVQARYIRWDIWFLFLLQLNSKSWLNNRPHIELCETISQMLNRHYSGQM